MQRSEHTDTFQRKPSATCSADKQGFLSGGMTFLVRLLPFWPVPGNWILVASDMIQMPAALPKNTLTHLIPLSGSKTHTHRCLSQNHYHMLQKSTGCCALGSHLNTDG